MIEKCGEDGGCKSDRHWISPVAACGGWNMFLTQMEELQLGSPAARTAKSGGWAYMCHVTCTSSLFSSIAASGEEEPPSELGILWSKDALWTLVLFPAFYFYLFVLEGWKLRTKWSLGWMWCVFCGGCLTQPLAKAHGGTPASSIRPDIPHLGA